tara:strand:- start:36536 stop:37204 length:669 start_codon:yes stop_codon:yes gene_type:complete
MRLAIYAFVFILIQFFIAKTFAANEEEWVHFEGYQSQDNPMTASLPLWQNSISFWSRNIASINECAAQKIKCNDLEILAILSKLETINKESGVEKIRLLNRYINLELGPTLNKPWQDAMTILDEPTHTGVFTVLKYFILKRLGYTNENMRIVVVRDTLTGLKDSFLFVRIKNEVFVLSNNFNVVLERKKLVNLYMPIYAIDDLNQWVYKPKLYQNIGGNEDE